MKVLLNDIVRAIQPKDLPATTPADANGYLNYHYLLSNAGLMSSGNIRKPMFYHADTDYCCPAMYFHSNPLNKDRSIKPWTDVLLPDEGLVYYNGDNQTPGSLPGGSKNSGNAKMERLWADYRAHEIDIRQRATPILVFEQLEVNGIRKGFRAFRGYGLVTNVDVRQEYEPKSDSVFSNYLFEIALLKVPADGIDWAWIYDRRDTSLPLHQINRNAPPAWKEWLRTGLSSLNNIRQRISHYQVSSPREQIGELLPIHRDVLQSVVSKYPKSKDKGSFEALAALIAREFFGENYSPGWITKHSGDMGIDFIGRLNLVNHLAPSPAGTVLGGAKLLVLGQAKCRTNFVDPASSEGAREIARVASRLQRGYIGIFVTTGVFKESTQNEVALDRYPIVLVNGRQLADLLIQYKSRTGLSTQEVFSECDQWYTEHRRDIPPEHFLRES